MPFEGNALARQEAKDQSAIQYRHHSGSDQVAPAPAEPGARQQVGPQPEHPAAGPHVHTRKTEQPDQRTAQQDDDRADGHKPIEPFDNHQGAQDQKGNQGRAQVGERAVQKR
ncbi:hypothetical protein EBI_23495 [Enterocytozoon bieneusi H348]|nr:hypothetical protein EBI_23495 [Enterocytozoon bieneusi H348]|eukprot:XP_002651739.1 hypothetical protein EBI_23495 [Enterocytozoon bieneusi H348]